MKPRQDQRYSQSDNHAIEEFNEEKYEKIQDNRYRLVKVKKSEQQKRAEREELAREHQANATSEAKAKTETKNSENAK